MQTEAIQYDAKTMEMEDYLYEKKKKFEMMKKRNLAKKNNLNSNDLKLQTRQCEKNILKTYDFKTKGNEPMKQKVMLKKKQSTEKSLAFNSSVDDESCFTNTIYLQEDEFSLDKMKNTNLVNSNIQNSDETINNNENDFSNKKDLLAHSPELKNNTYNKSCYYDYKSNYEIHNMNTIKIESPSINYLSNKNYKSNINNFNFKQDHKYSYTINDNNHIIKIKKEALDKKEIKKLINKKIGEDIIQNNKTKLNNTISKKILSKKTKDIKKKYNKFQYYIIANNENNMESISIKECSNCKIRITPTWRRGKNDNLLCNACGLYEKQNNKSRPFEKLENGFTKVFKDNNIIKHICANCKVEKSPTWRKGLNGQTLCNACGLFFKQHKSNRPCK